MSEPILPLYSAVTDLTTKYLAAKTIADAAEAELNAAKAKLFDAMPEHIEFATDPTPPVLIKRVGDKIIAVTKPTMHVAYAPEPVQ